LHRPANLQKEYHIMSIEFAIQPVMHGPGYEVIRTADNAVLTTLATAGEASQYIHNLELERRYDAERSGELYVKPAPPTLPDNPSDALESILEWIERHFADAEPPAGATPEQEFARGYQVGLAIGRSATVRLIQHFVDNLPEPAE